MVSTGHLLSPFAKIRADCAKVTAPKTSPCSATSHSISYGKSLARRACFANGLRVLWIPTTSSRCCSGSNFSALALDAAELVLPEALRRWAQWFVAGVHHLVSPLP